MALELVEIAYKEGIIVQIVRVFRSIEYQNELYEKGRTTPASIVTHAKGGQSVHNYGLAADFLILHTDGSDQQIGKWMTNGIE